eukprot:GHVN01001772.1.p1 GENE.GHVN01001772.1~~GHVN01001772.1.p1  ORF type:complete len:745 (-),score=152.62 GHVN01001772.1:277-2511(-)
MAAEKRKLQQEVDKVLKKIEEATVEFDGFYAKVKDYIASQHQSDGNGGCQGGGGAGVREKHEGELKRVIKKLQKHRDQLKQWQSSPDVKNKTPVEDARKEIEKRMELFKRSERQMKTKAFSKKGLALQPGHSGGLGDSDEEVGGGGGGGARKGGGGDKEAWEVCEWVQEAQEALTASIDRLQEGLNEAQSHGSKRGSKGGGSSGQKEKATQIETLIERHRWHHNQLSEVLTRVEDGQLDPLRVEAIHSTLVDYLGESDSLPPSVDSVADMYESLLRDDGSEDENEDEDHEQKGLRGDQGDRASTTTAERGGAARGWPSIEPDTSTGSTDGVRGGSLQGGSPGRGQGVALPGGMRSGRRGDDDGSHNSPSLTSSSQGASPSAAANRSSPVYWQSGLPKQSSSGEDFGSGAGSSHTVGLGGSGGVSYAAIAQGTPDSPPKTFAASKASTSSTPSASVSTAPMRYAAAAGRGQQSTSPQPAAKDPGPTPSGVATRQTGSQPPPTSGAHGAQPTAPVGQSQSRTPGGWSSAGRGAPTTSAPRGNTPGVAPGLQHPASLSGGGAQGGGERLVEEASGGTGQVPSNSGGGDAARGTDPGGKEKSGPQPRPSIEELVHCSYRHLCGNHDMALERFSRNCVIPIHPEFPQQPLWNYQSPELFSRLDADTLHFAFAFQQGKMQQLLAARQLKAQLWRYHTEHQAWYHRQDQPQESDERHEKGTYYYFVDREWETRVVKEFDFAYVYLEDESCI